MVNREDDMIVVDGQQPFLLRFEPLRFLEGAALGAMSVLAGFVVKLPLLADRTLLQDSAQGRCAASQDRTDRLALLTRKAMPASVVPDMLAENLRHFKTSSFRIYTVRSWRELYFGSCSFGSIVLTIA